MANKASKGRGAILALIVLAAAVGVCLALWMALRPGTNEGSKTLTVQVIHGDDSTREFTLRTEAEYLEQALTEYAPLGVQGDESQFGLYIKTVDGETASDADRTFWSISRDGVPLTVGAGGQPVADGEHYELTLTTW